MAVAAGPIEDLRAQLEEAVSQPGLAPAERIAKLRSLHERLAELAGIAQTYIGDVELLREAEYLAVAESLLLVRQNATLRRQLVQRGVATEAELDEAGYLSHEELDRLSEEGRLIESVEGIVRHLDSFPLSEAFGLPISFDPHLHPRDRTGKFRNILGKLSHGQEAHLPSGVKVKKEPSGFSVEGRGGKQEVHSAHAAAETALGFHDAVPPPKPQEQGTGKIHLPPKGRHGGAVPTVLHTHPPDGVKAPGVVEPPPAQDFSPEQVEKVVTNNVDEAVAALLAGKHVELQQPKQVSVLLDKLHEVAQEMKSKGAQAPTFDLCKVTVAGTDIFCAKSKGVSRLEMPQLRGVPTAGSKADALPKDEKGRVDLADKFRQHLSSLGFEITPGEEQASFLRPTQREIDGASVAQIMAKFEAGGERLPTLISQDDYVVDGHHGWAAQVGVDFRDGQPDMTVPVERVNMPITDLLDETKRFAEEWGVPQRGMGEQAGDKPVAAQRTSQKPWTPLLEQTSPPDSLGGDTIEWNSKVNGPEPTPEQVQQDLATARRIGLNDWPPKGKVAKEILGDAFDTEALYSEPHPDDPSVRVYSAERRALHEKILDTLMRARNADGSLNPEGEYLTAPPDGKPRVLFMGGGTASGKSTALGLDESKGVVPDGAVHIDPDEMKSMFPEYGDMVTGADRYAATAVHEESSHLAKELQKRAVKKGLNVVVDGTGNSPLKPDDPKDKDKFVNKMRKFKDAGYDVHAFYVNADTDTATIRSVQRAMKVGRWVPEKEVRKIHSGVSQRFNGEVMQAINDGLISDIRGFDTSANKPVKMFHLDASGKFVVDDQGAYDRFIAKKGGKEPAAPKPEAG